MEKHEQFLAPTIGPAWLLKQALCPSQSLLSQTLEVIWPA